MSAFANEEAEFRSSEAEFESAAQQQILNLTRDLGPRTQD